MDSSTEMQEVSVAKIALTKKANPTTMPAFPMAEKTLGRDSNEGNRELGQIDWDCFVAEAEVDGESFPVVFKVKTTDRDLRSQIYEIATKNEIGSSHDDYQGNEISDVMSNYGGTPTSGYTIAQENQKVNEKVGKSAYSVDDNMEMEGFASENAYAKVEIFNCQLPTKRKRDYPMLKKRHYLYLSESEHRVLIRSLVQMKNKLIQQGRFTDCVDNLILKVLSAPVKRI